MPPSQGYGRSYVYDLAYVDGHVYMAGFTKGNVTFHSMHVKNGHTGPTSNPDDVVVAHASPEDGETAVVYKITEAGVPVSVYAANILENEHGSNGYFSGLAYFEGDDTHIVGVGR